ncbi:hypothetical protein V6Z12_D13G263300 [Gossypium hirsutum]
MELAKEIIYVAANLFWFFHVNEMADTFHYHHLLQRWHIFFEPTIVNVFFHPWHTISQILITYNELGWCFDLTTHPWSQQLPIPANKTKHTQNTISTSPTQQTNLSILLFWIRVHMDLKLGFFELGHYVFGSELG